MRNNASWICARVPGIVTGERQWGECRWFPVRPVILMSDWSVELHTQNASEVWALNPKMLSAHNEREPVAVKTEAVAVRASRIVKGMQKL